VVDPTISGHPALELPNGRDQPVVITVCAECGAMRTVLFLSKDRWFCFKCRAEGAAPPNMFPLA